MNKSEALAGAGSPVSKAAHYPHYGVYPPGQDSQEPSVANKSLSTGVVLHPCFFDMPLFQNNRLQPHRSPWQG